MFQIHPRALVAQVAGIHRGRRLEQEDVNFFSGVRLMFDGARYDEHFAFGDRDLPVAKTHHERAAKNQKQFVLVLVMMPVEGPPQFHELNLLAIELAYHLGTPVLGEQGQLLREIYFFQEALPFPASGDCRSFRRLRLVIRFFEKSLVEEIKFLSESPLKSKGVSKPSGGEVLKGKANACENCDLLLVFTAILGAYEDFSKLSMYRFRTQTGTADSSHFDR
jgi:hypothetical protein